MAAEARMAIALEAIDRTRPGLESARKNLTGFQQQAQQTGAQVRQAMTGAVQGMTMAASSALMLYNAYDALGPVQAKLIRLQARRQATEAAIINYQRMLNQLTEKGRQGTEQYTYYQMQLSAAQERLRATTLMLEDAQDEMAKAYLRIALTAIPMVTSALQTLSLTTVRQVIPAIRGMSAAFLASPIGIITVAVTGLIAVLGYVTKGFKDWTVVTEALNSALRMVLTPLASFLDWVGSFIPEAKNWAEALRGVKVDLSGLNVVGESIDKVMGSLIPAAQATDSLEEAASNLASTLPSVQSQTQAAAAEISALGDEGWEAQASISQLNTGLGGLADTTSTLKSELSELSEWFDDVAVSAKSALGAVSPDEKLISNIKDLKGLLFEYAVKPSEEFQASLEEIAVYTWGKLRTEGVSSLMDLGDSIERFAEEWGLEWFQALSLIRGEIDRLAEDAKRKAEETGKAIEDALAKWRELGARGLPEARLERIRRLYGAERGAAYYAEAVRATAMGRYAEAARWAYAAARHGYAYPRELVAWAREHPAEWVEIWKGIRGAEFGGIFTRPALTLIAERGPEAVIPLEKMRAQPAKIDVNITFEHVEISSKEDVDYLLTQLEDLIVEKAKTLRGGRIG